MDISNDDLTIEKYLMSAVFGYAASISLVYGTDSAMDFVKRAYDDLYATQIPRMAITDDIQQLIVRTQMQWVWSSGKFDVGVGAVDNAVFCKLLTDIERLLEKK